MSKAAGFNPLITAATPLLILMVNLQQIKAVESQEVFALRQKLVEEIGQFVKQATAQNYSQRTVLAARYCLCTALDEFVLSSAWGSQSIWHQQTLLSIIHKETSGGERFFVILEEMTKTPQENLPLLELIYTILSLGFEGKYYCEERAVREQIRRHLFNLINIHRKEPEKLLSPNTGILKNTRTHSVNSWSRLKILGVSLLTLVGVGLIFNLATFFSVHHSIQELWRISQDAGKIPLPLAETPAPPLSPKIVTVKVNHHVKHRARSGGTH